MIPQQYLVDGVEQRLCKHIRGTYCGLVASQYPGRSATCASARLDIDVGITNHPRSR